MGPKKRESRKRKTEVDSEGDATENRPERRKRERGNKKYIGAHVGIQGKA